jgi:hypothetical protein
VTKAARRFVAQAAAGAGWRVWDKKARRWWGPVFAAHPAELIDELNGAKRPDRLTELVRASVARPAEGERPRALSGHRMQPARGRGGGGSTAALAAAGAARGSPRPGSEAVTFVETVSPDDASGAVAEMYASDREIFGRLPDFTQAFSLSAALELLHARPRHGARERAARARHGARDRRRRLRGAGRSSLRPRRAGSSAPRSTAFGVLDLRVALTVGRPIAEA